MLLDLDLLLLHLSLLVQLVLLKKNHLLLVMLLKLVLLPPLPVLLRDLLALAIKLAFDLAWMMEQSVFELEWVYPRVLLLARSTSLYINVIGHRCTHVLMLTPATDGAFASYGAGFPESNKPRVTRSNEATGAFIGPGTGYGDFGSLYEYVTKRIDAG